MCGIIGVLSSEKSRFVVNRRKFFEQAIFADTLRGAHSTGMFAVPFTGSVDSVKRAVDGRDFTDLAPVKSLLNKTSDYAFLIGHNRYATKGAVNAVNAHPFFHGDIIGVHNGSLESYHRLPMSNQFDVDSDALIHSIDDKGIRWTLDQVRGSYALVWYDIAKEELYVLKNDKRPLAMGFVKGEDTILIASEDKMLEWIADRNYLELDSTLPFASETLYTFKKDKVKEFTMEDFPLPKYQTYQATQKKEYTHSRPSTSSTKSKREALTESILSKYGLKPKQEIELLPVEFTAYSTSSNTGWMEGIMTHDPFLTVQIHNISKLEYDRYTDKTFLGTTISGVREDKGGDHVIVGSVHGMTVGEFLSPEKEEKKSSNILRLPKRPSKDEEEVTVKGPRGFITLKYFDELTRRGCASCTGNVLAKDHLDILWTNDNQPLCKNCSEDLIEQGATGGLQ